MLKPRENIVHRLFDRQICRARPNAHIHEARKLYENIVPNHTVYDVECPDILFRKFTNDGQYLICFSRNQVDLVVYRHKSLSFCVKGEAADEAVNVPPKSNNFDAYFSHLYTLSLAAGPELVCADFFLATENGRYGIFATSTPYNAGRAARGAVAGVPYSEKITLFLVNLAEGRITDQRTFHDDFIHLPHNMGVFLYDDLLAVLSIRFQCVHSYQIRETGIFVDVRTLGEHCREDDELVLNSQAQAEEVFKERQASIRKARGIGLTEKMSDAGMNGWHPQWNAKQVQSAQRGQRNRRLPQRYAPRSAVFPGRPERNDPSTTGVAVVNQGLENPPLDVQYGDYFRGLFVSLENVATSPGDAGGSTSHTNGPSNAANRSQTILSRTEASGLDAASNGRAGAQSTVSGNNSRLAFEGMTASRSVGGPFRMRHGDSSAQMDSRAFSSPIHPVASTGDLQAIRRLGGSHSSGSASSSRPSLVGRPPHSNSSGSSSLGRSTSERGSASMRNTSTTLTTSDSGSRSIGSRQSNDDANHRDTLGSGRSSGNDVNGRQLNFYRREAGIRRVNGGPSVGPLERVGEVEYVTSSLGAGRGGGGLSDHQVCPQEHSPSRVSTLGNSVSGSVGRTSREIRQSTLAQGTVRDGISLDHHQRLSNEHTAEQPSSSDPTLPSGPRLDRAMVHRGLRLNGGRERDGTIPEQSQRRTRGRDTENTGTENIAANTTRRNRVGADAGGGGGGGEGGGNESQVLGGLKQRLLSFIYKDNLNADADPWDRAQRLKWFYRYFQDYLDLLMWKVQFLDRHHLLIKFGSLDGVLQRNSDTSDQNAFLAIFNLQTTEVLGFYQNSSDDFLLQFEKYCDHFRVAPRYPLYMNYISSCSNNSYVREQLRKQRTACSSRKAGSYSQIVKRTLAWVPFNSQCQSPSVYFDQYLFHYDEKLISATDRHKPCMEHPVKFISRRRPNTLKFKINPGPELGVSDGRTKGYASFIFHPVFPFAISVQQAVIQPRQSIINFHYRK